MKKTLFAFAAVVVALVSCQKEISPVSVNEKDLEARDCFVASLDQSTKTFIDDSLQVKWSADDSISVNGVIYEISGFLNEDSTKAEFTKRYNDVESPKAPFKAYYPVMDFKKDGSLQEILRRTNENRFNMPMVAQSNTRTMEFLNPYGVLAIKVLGSDAPQGVSMIDVFEGADGVACVMYEAPACPVDSAGSIFYIPMEPRTYDNLEVRVVNTSNTDKMFSKAGQSIKIDTNTLYAFNFEITLLGISLTEKELELEPGQDSTLIVTFDPVNASNKNLIWSSTVDSVATVMDGKVAAVKPGNTQIIVKSVKGSYSDTCNVTVSYPISVKIDTTKSISIAVGDSVVLKYTVSPNDAVNKNVSWSSLNPDTLYVDANGKVKVLAYFKDSIAIVLHSEVKPQKITDTCYVKVVVPDYIEGGNNYGKGIYAAGICWAPVNCGYDSNHPYGKLYQWGRKYGQGYNGEPDAPTGSNLVEITFPNRLETHPDNTSDNEGKFYMCLYTNYTWYKGGGSGAPNLDDLWKDNEKTSYDPCPEGWRVPTRTYLVSLRNLKHVSTSTGGPSSDQTGLLIGTSPNQVFLPLSGDHPMTADTSVFRGKVSDYWSSTRYEEYAACTLGIDDNNSAMINSSNCAYGHPVRCVKE